MSGERTEAPTQRRLEEARRKGQGVGRSHELSQVMTLVAGLLALNALLPGVVGRIAASLHDQLATAEQGVHAAPASLLGSVGGAIVLSVTLVLPLGIAVMVAGVLGNLAGGGFILSSGAIRFDPARLNPITGLKRIGDKPALTRLGLSMAKLAILVVVVLTYLIAI